MMMSDDLNTNQMQEDFLKNMPKLEEGNLIEGIIVEVRDNKVVVDVGLKSEALIDKVEFDDEPQIGSKVILKLLKTETADGSVLVSKRQADGLYYRKVLDDAFKNKKPIKGKISSAIKGGYNVDLGYGFSAFLPQSKASIEKIENPDELLGIKDEFYIEKLEIGKRTNIVLNRKSRLVEVYEKRRDDFYKNVKIGDIVDGVVKSFTSFGAFIDLGGFDGLLHKNDMSWGHVKSPREYVKKDDKLQLIVIHVDPEHHRINLSLKHFHEDPWASFEEKFSEGDVVKGTVTKLTDFGAFIQIAEGIEGLAHISEFSWSKRINHPKEVLKIGDQVDVKILSYDVTQGKVSLGIKQVTENPWDSIFETFPIGKIIKGKVVKLTSSGAFIDIGDGMEGFVFNEDLSWSKKVKNPANELTVGQEVDVKILNIDTETRRIKLGVKQVSEDPWTAFKNSYPKGSLVDGHVSGKTEFGIFVKVVGGIDGLIPKSLMTDKKDESPDTIMNQYQIGDKISSVVFEIMPERQKLTLSLKDYQRQKEKEEISHFIHREDNEKGLTLEEVMKKS
jgi:small subunit ribosomal protein S1